MADYYRILSYLYRYDKKNKTDCKGFVKAEQKKNGMKITLQIDDDRLLEDIKLELCFYGKEENQWKMRRLASLNPPGIMKNRTVLSGGKIAGGI